MTSRTIVNFEEFTEPVIVARGAEADAMTRESVQKAHEINEKQ